MTAHVHRDHLFQSQMASNGLVPTNMQERLMKEAVMHEQRGAGHHKLQNQIYSHKMLNDHMASSATYTTNNSGAFASQMKSHQTAASKKAFRSDNTSIGPTSKFKSSVKTSGMGTGHANIKHVYGYGGGVLSSSNQNV